ncbi:hypothetical protein ACRALDRAFT_209922 [Sodiomyces alcalophilus JCM 7366]|uniref:uncharacterized protein n=1 Tax=Sodiomyces alcalophilus JCM 7366 TaxID=591952 RepID=UPI0039B50615
MDGIGVLESIWGYLGPMVFYCETNYHGMAYNGQEALAKDMIPPFLNMAAR